MSRRSTSSRLNTVTIVFTSETSFHTAPQSTNLLKLIVCTINLYSAYTYIWWTDLRRWVTQSKPEINWILSWYRQWKIMYFPPEFLFQNYIFHSYTHITLSLTVSVNAMLHWYCVQFMKMLEVFRYKLFWIAKSSDDCLA